ncbi:MAG: HNH endonuclease [Myxococcota bacterium]|nr:HNH endonuclease [Myxococcota bacterium]
MDPGALDRDRRDRDRGRNREDRSQFPIDPFPLEKACKETRSIATDRDRFVASSNAESELAQLTAASGPLRRTLAAICARLLETRAYERLCYARLRDYARERAGLSARQLQDLAHAHRAFATLPGLERALVANELPWSKVRLLTRVATPDDEERWIERARLLSIRQLEQEVRAARGHAEGDLDAEADPPRVRVTLHCTPAVREQWLLAREFAERVSGQSLREDEALEWVTAEALSAVSIDASRIGIRTRTEAGTRTEIGTGEPVAASRPVDAAAHDESALDKCVRTPRPDALTDASASLDRLVAGLDEADAFELDRRLRAAIRREQTLDAAIAPLLRLVTCPEYEWNASYWKLSDSAAELLGMSASKARALLRIERAGDACPDLRTSFRDGRLSWAKAQCLLPLLLLDIDRVRAPDWRRRWVAWAEGVTVRRLEADVERALLLRAGHHPAFGRCLEDPARTRDPIPEDERQMCAPDIDVEATERLDWRVPREVASLFLAVRESLRGRLRAVTSRPASEGDAFAAMLDHALATWTLSDPSKPRPDPVFERDGYRCAVPGCSSRMGFHDHHVVFRSHQGSDELANRLTLCVFHHQRCLHAGRLRIRGLAPDRLVFELGVRPGRRRSRATGRETSR